METYNEKRAFYVYCGFALFLFALYCLLLCSGCSKKSSSTPAYTITYTAYSKVVPWTVGYSNGNASIIIDTVKTNNFSMTITTTLQNTQFVCSANCIRENKGVHDSLHVETICGYQDIHNQIAFQSNLQANIHADITTP